MLFKRIVKLLVFFIFFTLEIDPSMPTFYANRAAAYIGIKKVDN